MGFRYNKKSHFAMKWDLNFKFIFKSKENKRITFPDYSLNNIIVALYPVPTFHWLDVITVPLSS